MPRPQIDASRIPAVEVRLLSAAVLSAVKEFYSDPQNEQQFELWKRLRQQSGKNKNSGGNESFGVDNATLAKEIGVSAAYLSTVLNGHKALTESGKRSIQERLNAALNRAEERKAQQARQEVRGSEMTPEERDRMQYETLKRYPQMIPEYPEALERHPDLKAFLPRKSRAGYGRNFNHEKFRNCLKQTGMTMSAFSTVCGIDSSSISDYCRGRRNPGTANRELLCKALNVPAAYFDI